MAEASFAKRNALLHAMRHIISCPTAVHAVHKIRNKSVAH